MAAEDYDLLIVSDLHLSEGRNRRTRKLSLIEDFLFDEEFARFLHYHMRGLSGRPAGRRWHLIINGDAFDFLQVLSTELDQEFLDYLGVKTAAEAAAQLRASREHPEYGFGTGAQEAVFKLWKIMDGHWQFFEVLAEFVVAGNLVSFGRGNHDVELIYPQVRAAFVPKLRRIYEAKLKREGAANAPLLAQFDQVCQAGAISFLDWFYYEKQLWVEHGHQYDELNAFRYWLAPYLPDSQEVGPAYSGEMDLPWGSFFVRYLFNEIETKEPFADNIKPTTRFVTWLLKTHPFLALHFVFHHGAYMLKKMARAWRPVPEAAYAQRREEHRALLQRLAQNYGVAEDLLFQVDALRAPNILKEPYGRWRLYGWLTRHWRMSLTLAGALLALAAGAFVVVAYGVASPVIPAVVRSALAHVSESLSSVRGLVAALSALRWIAFAGLLISLVALLWRALRADRTASPGYLAATARQIRDHLGVKYVAMGHTHDADLQPTSTGSEYFNTGTWTKVFSEEERLLRDENELVFLRGLRAGGQLHMQLMKWVDGAGEPRLVKLFADQSPATGESVPAPARALSKMAPS